MKKKDKICCSFLTLRYSINERSNFMKNFVALVLSAVLIFGVNFFAAENRNKIVKMLDPEETEIIHFTKNTEEGEEMIWSVMNSSEKKEKLLEILGKAERRNYKEHFGEKLTEEKYYVHFTNGKGQEFLYLGNGGYVCNFYDEGYEVINADEILTEIEALLE